MLIDWFTVAAQALNFIILVWLMRRVLYKPVMAAIEAREALVAAEIVGAAAKMNAADQATEDFRLKNEGLERDRTALMSQAAEQAKAQGSALLEAARVAADALQAKRRDAMRREGKELSESLRRRTQQAFLTLSRRALRDLADSTLEAQVTSVFCERLRTMKQEEKAQLNSAIHASTQPVLIRSAFSLPPTLQNTLQTLIDNVFERPIALRFEVAPALVVGIELTAQGQRVGWSIAEYLSAFERAVTDALPTAAPATNSNPTPDQAAISSPIKLLAIN